MTRRALHRTEQAVRTVALSLDLDGPSIHLDDGNLALVRIEGLEVEIAQLRRNAQFSDWDRWCGRRAKA